MLILYTKQTCFYCHKVRTFAVTTGITLEQKDVNADPKIMSELIERGGKRQVPYLVDQARGVSMYESDDIVNYLKENYVH